MDISTIIVSFLSGGLSGGCVSVFFKRRSYRRQMRTQLYQKVSDMFAAYQIRMVKRDGRWLVLTVGDPPPSEDEKFVYHRSSFICDLVQFNELDEAILLRTQFWQNSSKTVGETGTVSRIDLTPESEAIHACLGTLHKELGLERK